MESFDRATTWARHEAARAALRQVLAILGAAGVEALPVKGVVTAAWLYPDVADRPITDVDVRIRPADVGRAARALDAAGLTALAARSPTDNLVYEVGRMMVDVEPRVGPPGLCALTVDAMLRRATESGMLGFRCLVPDPTDHAIHLVVNVFKDKLLLAAPWSLTDLERLVRHVDFDRERLVLRAQEAHVTNILAVVSAFMARRDPAWEDVARRVGPPPRRAMVALARAMESRPSSRVTRTLTRFAGDRPRDWAIALLYAARIEWWKIADRRGSRLSFDRG